MGIVAVLFKHPILSCYTVNDYYDTYTCQMYRMLPESAMIHIWDDGYAFHRESISYLAQERSRCCYHQGNVVYHKVCITQARVKLRPFSALLRECVRTYVYASSRAAASLQ